MTDGPRSAPCWVTRVRAVDGSVVGLSRRWTPAGARLACGAGGHVGASGTLRACHVDLGVASRFALSKA